VQVPSFVTILDLEQLEVNVFRGQAKPTLPTRSFGGEVAAQALVAAGRTVPVDRLVHSLHAYFLRPGDATKPLIYQVDVIRDGGSFTTRRVVAVQDGIPVFNLAASFHRIEESGFAHQQATLTAPRPEDSISGEDMLADADEASRRWYAAVESLFPLELRFPAELPRLASLRGEAKPPRQGLWLRSSLPLPDDPLIHACAATFASDLFLLSSSLPPHVSVVGDPHIQFASLDHAVWFHAPFRADEWLYYDQEGYWAGNGRALCRASFFDRSGTHVASVMQEGLLRRIKGVPHPRSVG
jgi:acyl-CoA thioesterase-2